MTAVADALPDYFTFTYPRRSSDFCLCALRPPRALFGVSDMIGHPEGLRWRNYMRVLARDLRRLIEGDAGAGLAELQARLTGHLLWHDQQIFEFRQRHDRAAFGFCVLFVFLEGVAGRLHWLGDCRAYRITRSPRDPADGSRRFRVRCLTRDHNALAALVEDRGEITLFRDEMIEQAKRLNAFLGLGVEEHNRELLTRATPIEPLTTDDCLLLMTDGLYVPHLRASLDGLNFHLNHERLYLESWLARLLEEADRRIPDDEPNYWSELATILVEETLKLVRHRRHYRDDMALTGIYVPES